MNSNNLHLAYDTEVPLLILREWSDNPDLDLDATSEANGWTTFDLDCDFLTTSDWLELGLQVDLIYASYFSDLCMGELVVVRAAELQRHFLHHDEHNADDVNVGKLEFEVETPTRNWCDVWGFVDDSRWTTPTKRRRTE